MQTKLTPTRYDQPCPICFKTNGNCRIQGELVLCMTFANSMEKRINGHNFIGNDNSNHWGKFLPDSGSFSSQDRQEYQAYKQAQEQARLEQFKGSLSLKERDKNIRAIVKDLGLSESDRQKLKNRGLNDSEINNGYFATIKPFTELSSSISTRLAGIYIGRNGQPHIGSNFQSGILCPIWNIDGLIIGYQIRRESEENKYIWPKTRAKGDRCEISSHLSNGELPITVFRNSENNKNTIENNFQQDILQKIQQKIQEKKNTPPPSPVANEENVKAETFTQQENCLFASLQQSSFANENQEKVANENENELQITESIDNKEIQLLSNSHYQELGGGGIISEDENEVLETLIIPYCKDFSINNAEQGYLCDGMLKSKIANVKHNINIAGASGGNFLASKSQYLNLLNNGYDIYILDGGDILNQSVIRRLERLANWTKENTEKQLKFAWYGQIKKDNNDIDEIEKFEYDLLTINELIELADYYQFISKKQETLNKLKRFTPDVTFNSKFCLDELIKIDYNNKILAVKAPMGTGKTHWGKNLVNNSNDKFILINNRRVLCSKLAIKLALEYINQEKDTSDIEQALNRATESELEAINGLAIVIDSLLKLKEANYQDSVLFVDEANQLVESLFLSNTHIKSVRGRVIRLLSDIVSKAKSVILCDANLSDHTVNFFSSLNKDLKVVKIENEYKETSINLYSYPNQESIKSELESRLADGQKICLVSDSAKELTAINDLVKNNKIKSVLITQNNLADYPALHRFLENDGKAIKDENLHFLSISPVAQSGISIEIENHFDAIFGLIFGVVSTDTARQLFKRERSLIDRHIWIADRGIGYTTNYDPKEILENEDFKNEQVVIGSQLFGGGNKSVDESILEWAKAIIEGKDDLRKLSEKVASELIAKNNIEKSDYKSILLDECKTEGYQVIEIKEEEFYYDEIFHKQIKSRKKINDRSEAKEINQAENITDGQAKILENQDSLKETERHKLKKFKIQQSLPEFKLDEEFIYQAIIKDRFRTINGVNNYYLANNPEIANILDNNQLIYQFNQVDQGGIFWSFDLRAKTALTQIFNDLGIQKLIDSEEILSKEKIDKFVHRFRWHRDKLKIFNIKFGKKTDNTFLLKKLLELFGHTLRLVKRTKDGQRFYQVAKKVYRINKQETLDRWLDIYSAIEKKYLSLTKKELNMENMAKINFNQKIAKSTDIYTLDAVSPPPDLIKSLTSGDTHSNADIVKDKQLFIGKVIKNEGKIENKPLTKPDEKFLTNLKIGYILEMSDREFNYFSSQWLENGMSQAEFDDLIYQREQKKQLEEKLWEWATEIIKDDGSFNSYAYKRIICGLSKSSANQLNELLNEILPF